MSRNPYNILDIDKNSDKEEVRDAYRDKVKKVHPDVGGNKKDFQEVKRAYNNIMDREDNGKNNSIVEDIVSQKSNKNNKNEDNIYPSSVYYMNYDLIDIKGWDINKNTFENHSTENYSEIDFGKFEVKYGESILESAERNGFSWPFSCRGGACSNCAIKVVKGDVKTPRHHILNDQLLEDGYRLSCIGEPLNEEIYIVYNINKHPDIQNLLLPSREN